MVRYSAVSDERGEYHVLGLPAGQYVLTVEQPGFRMYRQSGITLRLGDRTALDVKLQVGQPSQSVEVTAAAPLLQTASGEVSPMKPGLFMILISRGSSGTRLTRAPRG